MNQRSHLTVIAAAASLMSAIPLEPLFSDWAWLIQSFFLVAVICAALLGARALRAPLWAQPLVGLVALLFATTWTRADGHAYGRIIPDVDTLRYFHTLVTSAGTDMQQLSIPVGDTPGLLFLTTTGVAVCYVLVDLFAVGMRRPALAGLPMLAIYAVPVEIDVKSTSLVAFGIGACGFLWLLVSDSIDRVRLFGRRFTGDGHGVDSWESSPLASIGRRITLVGVLLAIIVPAALPGVGKGFIHTRGNGPGSGNCVGICNANGSTVNLFANLADQLHNAKPANELRVQTVDDAVPEYLRFAADDVLTKQGFQSSPPSGGPLNQSIPIAPVSGVTYKQHTAKVTIQNYNDSLLPIYLTPLTNTISGVGSGWAYDSGTNTVFSPNRTAGGLTYTFTYDKPDYSADALREAPPLPPNSPLYLSDASLPPQQVPQVSAIVEAAQATSTNEYDLVQALEVALSPAQGFSYKLSTKSGTTGTDIGNFLQQKQGFCVQYASALAWLVRAAHYPARVAFGFTDGIPIDGVGSSVTYQLTTANLHAWTEVYFQGIGWVPFDATPSIVGTVHGSWDQNPNATPNVVPNKSRSAAPTTSTGLHSGPAVRATGPNGNHGIGPGGTKQTPLWVWLVLAGLLAIALVFASPAVARAILRGRRSSVGRRRNADTASPGEPWVVVDEIADSDATRRRIHAAWAEFMDTLVDFDVQVDLSETPRTTTERVIATTELSGEAIDGVRMIGSAEQHTRYARRPAASPSLEPELRIFRQELAKNVSFGTRMRAICLPPSVIARWNTRFTETVARASARIQSVRDGFGRLTRAHRWISAPRRLLAGRSGR